MLPEITDIKRRRMALDITQAKLASEAGVSRGTIAKLEAQKLNDEKERKKRGHERRNAYATVKAIFDKLEELEQQTDEHPDKLDRITAGQVHNTRIECVHSSELVYGVWKKMQEKNYSQFPVKEGTEIVGSITEKGINRKMEEHGVDGLKGIQIKDIMECQFPSVSIKAPIIVLIQLLRKYQAVLTLDAGKVVGIVTNTDIGKALKIK